MTCFRLPVSGWPSGASSSQHSPARTSQDISRLLVLTPRSLGCVKWPRSFGHCTQSLLQLLSSGTALAMGIPFPEGVSRHAITKHQCWVQLWGSREKHPQGVNYTQTYLFNLLGMWATKWYFTSHLCNGRPASRNMPLVVCVEETYQGDFSKPTAIIQVLNSKPCLSAFSNCWKGH